MPDKKVIIRLVERKDAEHLRENCFSMNTLEEIQSDIEKYLQEFEDGKRV